MNKTTVASSPRYATTDLPLAAFLSALGHQLIAVRSDRGRGVFVFEDSPELQDATLNWSNDEPVRIVQRQSEFLLALTH